MLSKQQFSDLIKNNFLWPGHSWYLRNTINGLEGASNVYFDGTLEILIDYLYQQYSYTQKFTDIFSIDTSDTDKEEIRLRVANSLSVGTHIKVYGTINYNNEYITLNPGELDSTNYIYVGDTFIYEVIPETAYYTTISSDGYTESSPIYFLEGAVERVGDIANPTFLPYLSLKNGLKYDSLLNIYQNRKFVKSAIPIYRIKGSTLSIKRVMNLLGYECDVIEPYKLMLRYGVSKYSDQHHFQDWQYYHDGVFEIVTDNVSLSNYKDEITSLVQPVGTRLVGRANINLGLLPFLGDIITRYSDSYFIESIVKASKGGNIFDNLLGARSGNVELWGLYTDAGIEIEPVIAFRRIWDSQVFSGTDLLEPVLVTMPAGRRSDNVGPLSGDVQLVTGWDSVYDELTPLDIQLEALITTKNERPARRSEFAKRSGEMAMSGLDGESWEWKPYFILDSDEPVRIVNDNPIKEVIDVSPTIESYISFYDTTGKTLSVNRVLSGARTIYGIEIVVGYRVITLEDWQEKVYWMFTDFTNEVALGEDIEPISQTHIIYYDAPIIQYGYRGNQPEDFNYYSGRTTCLDINIEASS